MPDYHQSTRLSRAAAVLCLLSALAAHSVLAASYHDAPGNRMARQVRHDGFELMHLHMARQQVSPASASANTAVATTPSSADPRGSSAANPATSSPTNANADANSKTSAAVLTSPTSASRTNENLLSGLQSGISDALNGGVAFTPSPASNTSSVSTTSSSSSTSIVVVDRTSTIPASTTSPPPTLAPVVLTQTVSETLSSNTTTPSSTAAAANASSSSSGINKSTIIIIIVVASCVGGAIAIWTIVRKIKLSPSSRFDRKMAPIDFTNNRRDSDMYATSQVNFAAAASMDSHGRRRSDESQGMADTKNAWPLHRSHSQSSAGHGSVVDSLHRKNSAGAATLLGRADSLGAKSALSMGENAHQHQYGNDLYPALPPPVPSSRSFGNAYGGVDGDLHHQYAHQQQVYGNAAEQDYYGRALDYGGSVRRPAGGY